MTCGDNYTYAIVCDVYHSTNAKNFALSSYDYGILVSETSATGFFGSIRSSSTTTSRCSGARGPHNLPAEQVFSSISSGTGGTSLVRNADVTNY